MRLTFRRTHFELEDKDPEEALVDVIADAFGFLPDLVRQPHNPRMTRTLRKRSSSKAAVRARQNAGPDDRAEGTLFKIKDDASLLVK